VLSDREKTFNYSFVRKSVPYLFPIAFGARKEFLSH
jgi:hypothetical protein